MGKEKLVTSTVEIASTVAASAIRKLMDNPPVEPKRFPRLFAAAKKVFGASSLEHPVAAGLRAGTIALDPKQAAAMKLINDSGRVAMLPEHVAPLNDFVSAMSTASTPLGRLYAQQAYDRNGAIAAMIAKNYGWCYSDIRVVTPADPSTAISADSSDAFARALSECKTTVDVRNLVDNVGTDADTHECYKHYPSMAEIVAKSLIPTYALGVTFGNVSRAGFDPMLWRLGMQSGSEADEFKRSHPDLYWTIDISGTDLRNLYSIDLDALLLAEASADTEFGRVLAERRAHYLADPVMQTLIPTLFGDDYAGSGKLGSSDFITFDHPDLGTTKFFTAAFQQRIGTSLKQMLTIANQQMRGRPGVMHIKGLGLGAFGIPLLTRELETLFLERLQQLLSAQCYPNIKEIRLLNFPSQIRALEASPWFKEGDLEPLIQIGREDPAPFGAPETNGHMRIRSMLMPVMDKVVDAEGKVEHLVTHIAGDRYARYGNEALAATEVPSKSSSDESAARDPSVDGNEHLESLPEAEIAKRVVVLDTAEADLEAEHTGFRP